MANNYLVVSPNGFGNVGDDICAYAGKYAIEQVDADAEIIITRPPMKARLVKWADYVVLSGGGVLYDRGSPENVDSYLNYLEKAHELGKKTAVLGVGVQGIVTDEGKKRYKEALNKCEFVSVRTQVDADMLHEIGVKKAQATFDIAFLTPDMISTLPGPKLFKKPRSYQHILHSKKPKLGICMINLPMLKRENYGGVFKQFDEGIEKIVKKASGTHDVLLMQHAKEDGKLMKAIAQRAGATFVPYRDITDLPSLYSLHQSLDLMVGVRLHSIALGIMSGTPTIGVGSAGAKQKRLADYALPTLAKQFYTFEDVEKLLKSLNQFVDKNVNPAKPLSSDEKSKIKKLNQQNVDILKVMVAS